MNLIPRITIAGAVLLGAGCYGQASTGPVYSQATPQGGYVAQPGYVQDDAPVNIETYPSVVYENRPVYLYNDRWYYRDGARWTYYRAEPAELTQHRARLRGQRPEDRREQGQGRVEGRGEVQGQGQGQGHDEHGKGNEHR